MAVGKVAYREPICGVPLLFLTAYTLRSSEESRVLIYYWVNRGIF